MRTADITWISLDRWNTIVDKNSIPALAPDFVIELKAETDNLEVLNAKIANWKKNGVKMSWLVCIEEKVAYVYRNGNTEYKVSFEEYLSGETLLRVLNVRLIDIFEY
jgi:Uma2 family endonuclease